jgi:tRNA dimethylallyltransferase
MWLALRREITIISADSRQIYRGFDLGTAKPTGVEQARVPHRGIDVVDPGERYSAAEWAEMADRAIREAFAARRLPVIVGGTGFYIAALFRPLWAEPPLDPALRVPLQRELDHLDTWELRRWCAVLDPDRSHLGRVQLLRAVEIALLCGRRLSSLHLTRRRRATWTASYLVVDPGIDLASRIGARARGMIDAGWPDEVRRLIETVPPDAPAWKATGYQVMRELVQGHIDVNTARERIVIETRQYAKRQRTWFRHQLRDDQVQRLAPESGWQERVDRWIAQFDGEPSMNSLERTP